MPSNYAIIVAGGNGTRVGNGTPKQFMLLAGAPLLMHTIRKFHQCRTRPAILVALPASQQANWRDLCASWSFDVPHTTCDGGATRFQSVKNSLKWIEEHDPDVEHIAVHDAARPLVSPQLIDAMFEAATHHGAAVPAVRSIDSVRLVDSQTGTNRAFPRTDVYLVQTPQAFRAATIIDAYASAEQPWFTDDASVVEAKKIPIKIIDGEYNNIKVTFPADLETAEFILSKNDG